MRARLESLEAIEDALWRGLEAAPQDREHPWRLPVLATTDGTGADARMVVLRAAERASGELLLYTDARAGKVAQAAHHPLGTLVFWSPVLEWQLRLRVHLSVATDGLAVSSAWARLRHSASAREYLSPLAPGSPLEGTPAGHAERAHFAIVSAQVSAVDWLELDEQGHRRARFAVGEAARWLQP